MVAKKVRFGAPKKTPPRKNKLFEVFERISNVYPGSLRQNQMFRPSETTEISTEETHHHLLQFVYGTINLWRQGQCSIQGGVGDQEHLKKTSIM